MTGLDDFGDTWWDEPSKRLCASSIPKPSPHTSPAASSAPGGEIQLILQNRLRMVDLWKHTPSIDEEEVRGPYHR